MNHQKYVMGIDVGTQAIKAGIFDLEGNLMVLTCCKYQHPTKHDKPNWATQNPSDWYGTLIETIPQCIRDSKIEPAKIISIGLDATCSTLLMIDSQGKTLGDAMLWSDRRAIDQSSRIQEISSNYSEYRSNDSMIPEAGLPKILWLKENDPRYHPANKVLESMDWLTYKLTGELTASRAALIRYYNYSWKRDNYLEGWPDGYLKSIGLSELSNTKIPSRKVSSGEKVGKLLPELSKKWELNDDVQIISGGLDGYSALVGMGICKKGQVGIILGSSIPIKVASEQPLEIESYFGPFRDLTIPQLYFNGTSIPSAGTLINWLINNSPYYQEKDPHSILEQKAQKVPKGSQGLFCIPYWNGVRSPFRNSHAKGTFTGFDFSQDTAHMFRAVYEGLSYSIRHSLEKVVASDYKIKDLIVCGGGTKSQLWMEILVDVLGIKLSLAPCESSVLGSAILAASGSGVYPSIPSAINKMTKPLKTITPNKDNLGLYSKLFDCYKEIAAQTVNL